MSGYHKVLIVSSISLQFAVKPINTFERPARKKERPSEGLEQVDRRFLYTFAWPYASEGDCQTAHFEARSFYDQSVRDYGQIATVELIPGEGASEASA